LTETLNPLIQASENPLTRHDRIPPRAIPSFPDKLILLICDICSPLHNSITTGRSNAKPTQDGPRGERMNVARIHILVVDGLPEAADIMIELLSIWGYEGAACYSGEEALKSASLRRPTVVLLDLAMQPMDGFQFTELFQKLPGCRSVPIIAVSRYSSLALRQRARDLGIFNYFQKPRVDLEYLKYVLAREIELVISPRAVIADFASFTRQHLTVISHLHAQ
jgi:CheY-like chemotaxis protein